MERVAELMEEGLDLIGRKKRGPGGGRLCEVHHYGDVRADMFTLRGDLLAAEFSHPRTGALAVAREEVGVDDSEEGTVTVNDLIGPYIGMIDRDFIVFPECDTVETGGESENSVNDVAEFEIGSQGLFIIGVTRVFSLLA